MKPLFTKAQARAIGRAAERGIHKRRMTNPAETAPSDGALGRQDGQLRDEPPPPDHSPGDNCAAGSGQSARQLRDEPPDAPQVSQEFREDT